MPQSQPALGWPTGTADIIAIASHYSPAGYAIALLITPLAVALAAHIDPIG